MKRLLAFLMLTISSSVFSALPAYNTPKILARANINDGYNLPAMSFLSNTSPVINNRGDVSFKLLAIDGQRKQGLWVKRGAEENGKIIYAAPDYRYVTDPSINDNGSVAFDLYDEVETDGVYTVNADTQEVVQLIKPNNNLDGITKPIKIM